MRRENTELVRERVLRLIEREFKSDAAFERAAALPEKTVNNWRRGLSASFMKLLPELAEIFGVGATYLLGSSSEGTISDRRLSEICSEISELPEDEREEAIGKIEAILATYSEKRNTGRG